MYNQGDFTIVLRAFMDRAVRTPMDLTRLTGLSPHTLRNWTDGKVRRPRVVNDVLKLARGLALDAQDTTTLLTAAGHPSLQTLQVQAQQTRDSELMALLASWPMTSAEPGGIQIYLYPPPALSLRHQLRPCVTDFVGRNAEIDKLVIALRTALAQRRGAVISGVQGMGGIGKTELAYVVAHQLHDTFPDAQIFLNLRGTGATPLTSIQALQAAIHTFAPDAKLTEDLDVLQQYYQSMLHGRRALILADDARDAAQVRPLLPPAGCALLITSRTRFTLPGMTTVDLEQLPADAASTLLRTICPRLSEAEAQAIARACASLPLALRVSGGLLRTTPALAVADYLAKLADAGQRLALLRDPDDLQLDVAAALSLSYAQLDALTQQLFRQLGVFVTDFPTALALDVVQIAREADVTALLHALLRCNLVMYDPERGRWRLHDLVRDLARSYLEAAGELEAAAWRYAWAAVRLAQALRDQYLAGGAGVPAALARFDAEQPHIDAGYHWACTHVETSEGDRLLLDAAAAVMHIGDHRHDLRYDRRREIIPRWERALAAAQRLGDQRAQALALSHLGTAHACLGDARRAIVYFEQCLTLAGLSGEQYDKGSALNNLGETYYMLGDAQRAMACYEQALVIARVLDERSAEALVLLNLGCAYAELGETRVAISYYEQAIAISRTLDDRDNEGYSLQNLGNAYTDLRQIQPAIEACKGALTIAQAIGNLRMEGYALSYLARVLAWQGDRAHATTTFEQAVTLFQKIGDRHGEAECKWLFGLALARQGERERAVPLLRAAVAYEQEIGHVKVAEHAALLARLEAGAEQPAELLRPPSRRAVGNDAVSRG